MSSAGVASEFFHVANVLGGLNQEPVQNHDVNGQEVTNDQHDEHHEAPISQNPGGVNGANLGKSNELSEVAEDVTTTAPEPQSLAPTITDDVDWVDMSMWTQSRSRPVSSDQPNQIHKQSSSPSNKQVLAEIQPEDLDAALSVSSGEEIPYTDAQGHVHSLSEQSRLADETIVIPRPISSSSTSHPLLRIRFLEGSDSLQNVPANIYNQLNDYCQAKKTQRPDVVKARWPPPLSIFRTKTGATYFQEPQNAQKLHMARYQYGRSGQFIVVRDGTSRFNSGKAAIVLCTMGGNMSQENGRITLQLRKWVVWDPFGESPKPLWVWRVIDPALPLPSNQNPSELTSQELMMAPLSEKSNGVASKLPDHDRFLQRGGALNAMRPSKRSAPPEDIGPPAKRSQSANLNIDKSLLKDDYPIIGSLGARRDVATGEILMRRKDTGVLIVLRCTDCDATNFDTQQGLLNHLRNQHNIQVRSHEDVVERCGRPIDGTGGSMPRKSMPHPATLSKSTSSRPTPQVEPTRRSHRRLVALPASTEPPDTADEKDQEPRFVFMKCEEDKNPRIRSLSAVNSAEKLFVNALVAGVAKRDTLMLTIAVDGKNPFHIVKNDREDYKMILRKIEKVRYKDPEIFVTVEDLED